jgi:hypothetical protein
MAATSKSGASLHPPRPERSSEAWKSAPSRETTHDDPEGENQRIERARKPLENAPRKAPEDRDKHR